jgi:hypothetical protein
VVNTPRCAARGCGRSPSRAHRPRPPLSPP